MTLKNAYGAQSQLTMEEIHEWWVGKGLKEAVTQPWETVRNLVNPQHSRQPRQYSNSNPPADKRKKLPLHEPGW
jgi:hypothetical protein